MINLIKILSVAIRTTSKKNWNNFYVEKNQFEIFETGLQNLFLLNLSCENLVLLE